MRLVVLFFVFILSLNAQPPIHQRLKNIKNWREIFIRRDINEKSLGAYIKKVSDQNDLVTVTQLEQLDQQIEQEKANVDKGQERIKRLNAIKYIKNFNEADYNDISKLRQLVKSLVELSGIK